MTQLSPSVLFTAQLTTKILQFKSDYAAGNFANIDEVVANLNDIINSLNTNANQPLTGYEPVVNGEPPSSDKINGFWTNLQADINNIEDQLSVLQAGTLFLHNFFATELEQASNKNAQAANKLKTLQLYTSAHDPSIVTFGDYFRNQDFVDTSLISADNSVSFDISGHISLGRSGQITDISKDTVLKILPTSNGFLGNNQEIDDPTLASKNPIDGSPFYTFVAQTNRHANLAAITDANPTTWIEYESNRVSESDREKAKNFNFTYRTVATDTSDAELVNWALGPPDGVLKLDLELDLKTVKTINRFAYTPFGLNGDINYPVKITSVQISETGTDWIVLNPQDVFVGTEVNIKTADAADNVTINTAEWIFPESNVRYIHLSIEQLTPVDSNVGHLYYLLKDPVTEEVTDLSTPTGVKIIVNQDASRKEGPIPLITNPTNLYQGNNVMVRGGLIQNAEYFTGKRWAIGVRDVLIQEVKYQPTSVMISKLFRINGIVDRVSIDADMDIPESFDHTQAWIKFYVSPDNGLTWYQISRIQDDYLDIPEIIAFNDPLPDEFREIGVKYFTVNNTVNSLRVKIEFSRPDSAESSTPVLRSYVLKVEKK